MHAALNLKRFTHALALAEELNFARAAERVFLSQPALSRSIQQLETELKCQLFERDHHHVALTTKGRLFVARARALISETQQLWQDLQTPPPQTSSVTVGYVTRTLPWPAQAWPTQCVGTRFV